MRLIDEIQGRYSCGECFARRKIDVRLRRDLGGLTWKSALARMCPPFRIPFQRRYLENCWIVLARKLA